MAQGYSVHIGVNEVDPHHYQGWSGPLNACEADAASYDSGNQRNALAIVQNASLNSQSATAALYNEPNDLLARTSSAWGSDILTHAKDCQILVVNPGSTSGGVQPRTLDASKQRILGVARTGAHRTNMLSLEETQRFVRQRLIGAD